MVKKSSKQQPKRFITKDRSNVEAFMKFVPASESELKKSLGDDVPMGYVAGWASTPDLDHYRHVVKAGSFDEAIEARGLKGPKGIKFLIGHNSEKPAGVIHVLETRNGKLWIEAQFNLSISYVRDYYEASKMNGGMNFSVGFYAQDYEWKEDDNKSEYLLITRGDLVEVSAVLFPGNEAATMEFVKAREDAKKGMTVADVVKGLVERKMAGSRNEAQNILDYFKEHKDIVFPDKKAKSEQPLEEENIPDGEVIEEITDPAHAVKTAPVLDAAKLQKLSDLVTQMKSALAPVATEDT